MTRSICNGRRKTSRCTHIDDGKYSCLPIKRCPNSLHATEQRYADNESYVEPVDVLVEISFCDWRVGDMRFLAR